METMNGQLPLKGRFHQTFSRDIQTQETKTRREAITYKNHKNKRYILPFIVVDNQNLGSVQRRGIKLEETHRFCRRLIRITSFPNVRVAQRNEKDIQREV